MIRLQSANWSRFSNLIHNYTLNLQPEAGVALHHYFVPHHTSAKKVEPDKSVTSIPV